MNNKQQTFITGYGVLCAAGENRQALLTSIKENRTGIDRINRFDTQGLTHNVGALAINYENYSTESFEMDLASQYAIHAVSEALEHANLALTQMDSTRVAFILGNANCGMFSLMESLKGQHQLGFKFYPPHKIATDVSRHFGIQGPVMTFTSACTASSSAIAFAKQLIENDQADVVIAGGADALSELVYGGFQSVQSLSPEPCAPYSEKMGLSLGEGAGFLVFESQTHANKRNATLRYQLLATGSSLDAHHATAPNPEGDGVRRAFTQTLSYAPVAASDIEYINSHGTGTPANDGAELKGIQSAIGEQAMRDVSVSSSKSYFGHTLGAAGAVELISTLVSQDEGLLPATLGVDSIRSCCQAYQLVTNQAKPQVVDVFAVTNSAFGGHNTSMLLSKHQKTSINTAPKPVYLLAATSLSDTEVYNARQNSTDHFAEFNLKQQFPALFQRRTPCVAQFALGACQFTLQDSELDLAQLPLAEFAAYYANPIGSLETLDKNLASFQEGIAELKSTHFPNTVVNATLGQLALGFGFKNSATCVSDLGNDFLHALWSATLDMREGRSQYAMVCSSQDDTALSQQVWAAHQFQANIGHFSSAAILATSEVLPAGYQPLAEIIDFIQINDAQQHQALDKLLASHARELSQVGNVVLSTHHDAAFATIAASLDSHLPQAQLIKYQPQATPQHSTELAVRALMYALNTPAGDTELDQTLLLSVNLAGSMTGCILRTVRK
ncbi:beta-ketoacyl-[acyl-carrier-protein] synthase family protein [Pseudoalteromonas piscicida]|uniref:3-oxoacyl-ACP synthase n=1 Tax=Pseudoalteromonas piscicida TaxID=43662 RepID=A0AAD0RI91_PSEO7|nr:beta-ketoacyl-[acyl-carrier-protein] synthase family protein [Pseudoalteromonas piscicida]ASD67561.1 3-oxoacyl-ACP synthase [Pseudoalteromonas piscicida]AXR01736.1 3-oxoacyl-ACP synthase [Pseudoalteromonas piscicida]